MRLHIVVWLTLQHKIVKCKAQLINNCSFDDTELYTVIVDFHEYIRFSKTHSDYQEQSYPLEKTTIVFLDPPRKMNVTFVNYTQEFYIFKNF